MEQGREGTEGPFPQTLVERGLKVNPPRGIVGTKINSMMETVGTTPMVSLSPSCYPSAPTRIDWH